MTITEIVLLCMHVETILSEDIFTTIRFWLMRRIDKGTPELSEREMKQLEIEMEGAEGSEVEEDYDEDEEEVLG